METPSWLGKHTWIYRIWDCQGGWADMYFFPFPYELPDNLPFTQSLRSSALLTKHKIIKELGPHQRALLHFISIWTHGFYESSQLSWNPFPNLSWEKQTGKGHFFIEILKSSGEIKEVRGLGVRAMEQCCVRTSCRSLSMVSLHVSPPEYFPSSVDMFL